MSIISMLLINFAQAIMAVRNIAALASDLIAFFIVVLNYFLSFRKQLFKLVSARFDYVREERYPPAAALALPVSDFPGELFYSLFSAGHLVVVWLVCLFRAALLR